MKKKQKKFLIELSKEVSKVKELFPKLFETKLVVETNKWYKRKWYDGDIDVFLVTKIKGKKMKYHKDVYFRNNNKLETENVVDYYCDILEKRYILTPAKESEVKEVLINEAKKRGFKKGVYIKSLKNNTWLYENDNFVFNFNTNELYINYILIFDSGKWATIENTYTKEQAEQKFNIKIV